MTPIKRGTARRLGLRAPTPRRRRRSTRRCRCGNPGLVTPLTAGVAAINGTVITVNQRPPDPVVHYIPVPYNGGMLA